VASEAMMAIFGSADGKKICGKISAAAWA